MFVVFYFSFFSISRILSSCMLHYGKCDGATFRPSHNVECNIFVASVSGKGVEVELLFLFMFQWDQIQELLGHPVEKPVVLHR